MCFAAHRMIERVAEKTSSRDERCSRQGVEVDDIPGHSFDVAENADACKAQAETDADFLRSRVRLRALDLNPQVLCARERHRDFTELRDCALGSVWKRDPTAELPVSALLYERSMRLEATSVVHEDPGMHRLRFPGRTHDPGPLVCFGQRAVRKVATAVGAAPGCSSETCELSGPVRVRRNLRGVNDVQGPIPFGC